jgi:polysaccharide biosynthesis/export protein
MARGISGAVVRDIQTLFDAGTASGLSDRQLLERFAGRRDASAEAAFEVLVTRHGPMVLRVCRNVLSDSGDAQDAFQATFLVLVERRHSIRRLESVGSWLYGVACRVAARARVEAARRRVAERRGGELRIVQAVDPAESNEPDHAEFGPIIQEEVRRLPEKYRAVVALCYWEGLTQEQAATQLGCPLGTVRSRLARARSRLHTRLTRRGLAPLATVVAAAFECQSSRAALVPSDLAFSTIKAATEVVTGLAMSDVVPTSVAVLTQSVLRSMFMVKLKAIAGALLLVGLGTYGANLAAPQADAGKSPPGLRRRVQPTAERSRSKAQPALVTTENYVVEPPDLLIVEVLEALPGRPISGERLVRPDGKISLGFYGEVYVAGLTLLEIKEKIVVHMQKYLTDEALGLERLDETGDVAIDPATKQPKLFDPKESDRVFVDVAACNSKNYYIQGCVGSAGRFPVTGKETVLDGINLAGGMTPEADHKKVILYRQPSKGEELQALPVDVDEIMMGDDLSTNYQLLAGDRLVVPRSSDFKPDVNKPEAEHHEQGSTQRVADPRFFDRQTKDTKTRVDRFIDERDRTYGKAAISRMETRLKDVEEKLDLILKALKSRTP